MENMSLKQQRGHQSKKKVRDNRENSTRERSAEFEGANDASVAISLAATIRSFWFLDILFCSHSSTT
jgi:hypothetical protein